VREKMFRLILGAYGHTVLTAENGEEGLQIFEKEKSPIVLTDVKMLGLGGMAQAVKNLGYVLWKKDPHGLSSYSSVFSKR
jgi:CheY-like chemotaxis protein